MLRKHRYLIHQLVRKELHAKYRKSRLGLAWLLISPLLLVSAYTLVFGVLLQVRWGGAGSTLEFALVLHAGVMFYMFFYEILSRTPTLISNHQSFVTKMMFPVEVLGWVVVAVALINFLVTLLVWSVLALLIKGSFPWGIVWVPLLIVPFALFCLGLCWLLSAAGVFHSDMEHAMPVVLLLLMYLSPLLFPVERMPEEFRIVVSANPLTYILENGRAALLEAQAPDPLHVVVGLLIGIVVTWFGLASFRANQRGFADVF